MYDDYIQKVYINKEITARSLDDYADRLGRFCVIQIKEHEHIGLQHRKQRIYALLSNTMKLMGYRDDIESEQAARHLEINECWVDERADMIFINHKYWNGHQIKLFCEVMEALGRYLKFEVEYITQAKLHEISFA